MQRQYEQDFAHHANTRNNPLKPCKLLVKPTKPLCDLVQIETVLRFSVPGAVVLVQKCLQLLEGQHAQLAVLPGSGYAAHCDREGFVFGQGFKS